MFLKSYQSQGRHYVVPTASPPITTTPSPLESSLESLAIMAAEQQQQAASAYNLFRPSNLEDFVGPLDGGIGGDQEEDALGAAGTLIYRPHHNIQYTDLVIHDEDMNDSSSPNMAVASVEDLLFRLSTTIMPQAMQPESSASFAADGLITSTSMASSMPMAMASTAAAQLPVAVAKSGININIIAYCYVMPIICVLGIIGNLMNVVTLASPRLRAVSYMYLRALAIADLLCMLFVLAFACCEVLKEAGVPIEQQPLYGFYQAHVMLSFINWALATGVYIVVALSLERYVSVVFPLHFRVWNSPQRAMKAIMVAYIVPALFYIPYGIGRYSVSEKLNARGELVYGAIDSEVSKTLGWQIYKWTREALLRFLPIIILFVLNFQIMIAFRRRQRMFDRLRNRETTRGSARDDTILYIMGGIAVMFFVCNIPAAINLLFINETMKKRLDYQIFRAVANLLEITNHAAQFYIFCVCSSDYRVTFMQKFPCLQAYYINKSKFCSFLRNASQLPATKRSTARRAISAGAPAKGGGKGGGGLRRSNSASTTPVSLKYAGDGCAGEGGQRETTFVRSTTLTAESWAGRTTMGEEPETQDVQMASEESLSDESETLLTRGGSGGPLVKLGMDEEDLEGGNNNEVDDEQTDRTDGTSYL